MKNKAYFQTRHRWIFPFLFIIFACKNNEENLSFRTFEHTVSPKLQSTVPADKATISPLTETATLTFNKRVTVADIKKITLNGMPVSEFKESEDQKSIILKLDELDIATAYTLSIPKGTIKGIPGTLNMEDIELKFSITGHADIATEPVMPNASEQTKKVYEFLRNNYRSKIISSAMAGVNWNITEAERVKNWTGKYPAMTTFDYIHHYATWIDYTDIKIVEEWWNNNGLVSALWHWSVPKTTGSSDMAFYYTGKAGNGSATSFDITLALQEGSAENAILKKDMNTIADYLLLLQAKNIPVIWRPLHEGAGGWFWWGAKGASAYKQLWIMMFETFKNKGINNLIWVWTTEGNDHEWYPGNAYVDIIGRDIYNKKDVGALFREYKNIRRAYPNKIITLSECGNVADIEEQWNSEAKWSWFMPWYDNSSTGDSHKHADKTFWEKAFASDKVITRENMPNLK